MDQDKNNDNLFDFGKPEEPEETILHPQQQADADETVLQPRTDAEETVLLGGGARVYSTPEPEAPVPPPPYGQTTPPAQPPAKSNRTWLIVGLVVLFLCCCCIAFFMLMYFVLGDPLLEMLCQMDPTFCPVP